MQITKTELNGFSYFISDEQRTAFPKMSDLERLQWVENTRLFTLMVQTPVTKARHKTLRNPTKV